MKVNSEPYGNSKIIRSGISDENSNIVDTMSTTGTGNTQKDDSNSGFKRKTSTTTTSSSPSSSPSSSSSSSSSSKRIIFPAKLYEMVDKAKAEGYHHIVSWTEYETCGFIIHDNKAFEEIVLPKHFKQSSLRSFQRQLSYWSFERINTGPEKGAYLNPHFKRDKKILLKTISRKRCKGKSTRRNGFYINLEHTVAQEVDQALQFFSDKKIQYPKQEKEINNQSSTENTKDQIISNKKGSNKKRKTCDSSPSQTHHPVILTKQTSDIQNSSSSSSSSSNNNNNNFGRKEKKQRTAPHVSPFPQQAMKKITETSPTQNLDIIRPEEHEKCQYNVCLDTANKAFPYVSDENAVYAFDEDDDDDNVATTDTSQSWPHQQDLNEPIPLMNIQKPLPHQQDPNEPIPLFLNNSRPTMNIPNYDYSPSTDINFNQSFSQQHDGRTVDIPNEYNQYDSRDLSEQTYQSYDSRSYDSLDSSEGSIHHHVDFSSNHSQLASTVNNNATHHYPHMNQPATVSETRNRSKALLERLNMIHRTLKQAENEILKLQQMDESITTITTLQQQEYDASSYPNNSENHNYQNYYQYNEEEAICNHVHGNVLDDGTNNPSVHYVFDNTIQQV